MLGKMGFQRSYDLVAGLCGLKKLFTFALTIHLLVGSFSGVAFLIHMAFIKLFCAKCKLQYLLDD